MREGCEEARTLGGVPRMKEDDDDDDDENVNNEETTTTTTTCVWLRDQRRRWMSFLRGRRARNVRVGR